MQSIYNFLKVKLCYRTYWKQWLAFFTICLLVFGCTDDEPCDTSPSFSSVTPSNISYTSLSLSGTISPSDCDSNLVTQGMAYSTSELPSQSNSTIVFSDESYNLEVTGLATSTTYYFRPFFVNQDGVFYGNQISVTTLSTDIEFSNIEHTPYITTIDASGNYSFLQGQGVNVISKGVRVLSNTYIDNESPNGVISLEGVGSLIADSPATFELFVETEFGFTFSETVDFNTTSTNSEVSTTDVTDIDFTSVNLFATYENQYNGNDITSEKGFEISINENFSNSIFVNSTSAELTIESELTNLNATSQYYVKAFVTNEYGTNYGAVNSFSTLDAGSEFTTVIISEIGFDTATFSSSYENLYEGEDLTYERGFIIADNPQFNSPQIFNSDENGLDINYSASNLELNTTYYIKAFVTNQYGTTYSESSTFETQNLEYSFSYIINGNGYDYLDVSSNYSQVSGNNVEIIEKGIKVSNGVSTYNVIDSSSQEGEINLNINNLSHNTDYSLTGYLTTQFGEYLFDSLNSNTTNATPTFNSESYPAFADSEILVEITYAPETENSVVRLGLENQFGNYDYYELDNEAESQYILISNLNTSTEYNYVLEVVNQYGNFVSEAYSFMTMNDEPNIDFSYELTGDNQITLSGTIVPADELDFTIDGISIRYKHHEQDNYSTINLDSSNYSILEVLDDLIQGPNYNFKLVVTTQWNTFESDLYYNLPVTYEVGDYMFGGVIAYIDNTGYHGYVVSELEYVQNLQWSDDKNASDDLIYLSDYDDYNDGAENTQLIVDFHSTISASAPAAEYCANLNINGYDDWYLGSEEEYSIAHGPLWYQLIVLNGAPHNTIWTSNTRFFYEYPELLYFATQRSYNGCSGNNCSTHQDKEVEVSVWPIRKF